MASEQSASPGRSTLETFEVGPCKDAREMGFLVGQRFSHLIRSRVAGDLILRQQLLPFTRTRRGRLLLHSLSTANRERFPEYWDEMLGTAEGSGAAVLEILLLNLRKELLPFLAEAAAAAPVDLSDCSDISLVTSSTALAAHNEDANVALVGHTYLIKATLAGGRTTFTAYTYAGELPTCAFGFNSHGLAFTLNSVPSAMEEIREGAIGRNFISRGLLEATGMEDALQRLRVCNASVGHSYNLVDVGSRRIVNVETASSNRVSVREVGESPFFHANMYLHLRAEQAQDENSVRRQRRAALLPATTEDDMLRLLGDSADEEFPIYMTGPALHTLCTVLINLDRRTLSIIQGNPKCGEASHVFELQ